VEDRRISKNGATSLLGGASSNSYLSPDDAAKKIDIDQLGIPRECSTFALYLQENCKGTRSSDAKCLRTNEYYETCKDMFGSCGSKHYARAQLVRNTNESLSITNDPQDSVEMNFLNSVTSMCDKMSLALVMCNTQSHFDECSGCQARLDLLTSCSENIEDPKCAQLTKYFNECPQPCDLENN